MSGALIVKTFFIFSAMPTEMMGNMPLELLMLSSKALVSTGPFLCYVTLYVLIFSQDSPFICPLPSRRSPSPDTRPQPLLETARSVPGASIQSHSAQEFPRSFAGSLADRT
jgi:hypothetical protein